MSKCGLDECDLYAGCLYDCEKNAELDEDALVVAAKAVYKVRKARMQATSAGKSGWAHRDYKIAIAAVNAYQAAYKAPDICADAPIVYSRPECPFNYCDAPELCQPDNKCRHDNPTRDTLDNV